MYSEYRTQRGICTGRYVGKADNVLLVLLYTWIRQCQIVCLCCEQWITLFYLFYPNISNDRTTTAAAFNVTLAFALIPSFLVQIALAVDIKTKTKVHSVNTATASQMIPNQTIVLARPPCHNWALHISYCLPSLAFPNRVLSLPLACQAAWVGTTQ